LEGQEFGKVLPSWLTPQGTCYESREVIAKMLVFVNQEGFSKKHISHWEIHAHLPLQSLGLCTCACTHTHTHTHTPTHTPVAYFLEGVKSEF